MLFEDEEEDGIGIFKAKRGRAPHFHHLELSRSAITKAAKINVKKPPAVFVIFGSRTSVGGGIQYADYISDNMEVEVYNEQHLPIRSQDELHECVKSWEHGFVERANAKNVQHMVMSYPITANPKAVLKAAADTLEKSFEGRE